MSTGKILAISGDRTITTIEQVRSWITPDKVAFVVMMQRTGAKAFMVFLEYRHFAPGSATADELQAAMVPWKEMCFGVVVIPASKRPLADAIARELGLRFANGVPVVMQRGNVAIWVSARSGPGELFPISLPNVFNVENIEGSFVFRNNPALQKSAADFEREACDRVVREHEERRREGVK